MGKSKIMKNAKAAATAKADAAETAAADEVTNSNIEPEKKAETGGVGNRKCQPLSGSDSSASDSDDGSELDLQEQAVGDELGGIVSVSKHSRCEKKARRMLVKLDLEPVPNVTRVSMLKVKNVMLFIDQPEVFKCPNSNTIICFGEVRVEDTSNAAAAQAAERYLKDVNVRGPQQSKDGDQLAALPDDDDELNEDEANAIASKMDERDIELVQMQAECSRRKAIKALLKHNNDLVNAILEITVG